MCSLQSLYEIVIIEIKGVHILVVEIIKNRILHLCEDRRITVSKLSTICALPPSSIKNILYGKSQNPKIATIKKICDGLEITLSEFFDTDEFNNLDQEIE